MRWRLNVAGIERLPMSTLLCQISLDAAQVTLKALITTTADDILRGGGGGFWENKAWRFMWIVCLTDDSHEISDLISL